MVNAKDLVSQEISKLLCKQENDAAVAVYRWLHPVWWRTSPSDYDVTSLLSSIVVAVNCNTALVSTDVKHVTSILLCECELRGLLSEFRRKDYRKQGYF